MTNDEDIQRMQPDKDRLEKIRDELLEHYDSVAIFVTRYRGGDDGGTDRLYFGGGNWFARYGQIRCWIVRQDAETAAIDDRDE